MGHKNNKFLTILVALVLLIAGIFAYTKIDAKGKTEKPSENPAVKGGEVVNCAAISPRVDTVLETVSISRKWYLIDDSVSKEYREILLDIPNTDIPDATTKFFTLKYSVENTDVKGNLEYSSDQKKWLGKVDLVTLKADTYKLLVSADIKDCEYGNSKDISFNLSYPVYVTWTLDWEGTDVKNSNLENIANISSKYGIPVTHFFNPHIYHILSANRQKYLTDWILSRKSMGDSVGLHLHMYSRYVSKAGVTPKNVRWGYNGYGDGYDVPTSEYSYAEFMKILALAKSDFNKHGLGTPTMYRAGGWFADSDILKALEDSGFTIDSSGRSHYTIGTNKLEGHWTLSSTTQPYQLSSSNQNITNNPDMKLWEVPNNGADSWAFNGPQLIGNFNDNYSGGINNSTKVVTYLSHPQGFGHDVPILHELFTNISKYSFNSDSGPLIYTTIDKLPMVSHNR